MALKDEVPPQAVRKLQNDEKWQSIKIKYENFSVLWIGKFFNFLVK
jgi:hypothetical protein